MAFAPSISVFFMSILLGAFFGLVWECFRIFRIKIGDYRKLVFILDVLYFSILSVLTIWFLFTFNSGGFRLFIVIGEFLGFTLYYVLLNRPFFLILNLTLGSVFDIFIYIFKTVKSFFLKFTLYSEKKILIISQKRLPKKKQSMYNCFVTRFNKNKKKRGQHKKNYDKKKY